MEKINTPLMQLKEDIKKWKPQLQKRQQDAVDKILKHIDSIIPNERDVIEKVYNQGIDQEVKCIANGKDKKCYCTNQIHCEHKHLATSTEYFTQTFKSYE